MIRKDDLLRIQRYIKIQPLCNDAKVEYPKISKLMERGTELRIDDAEKLTATLEKIGIIITEPKE